MADYGKIASQTLSAAAVFGIGAAVICGGAAWGSRFVEKVPTQSISAGALAGGVFGISAGVTTGVLDGTRWVQDSDRRFYIGLILGIAFAVLAAPSAAKNLLDREITHQATGTLTGVAALIGWWILTD